MDFTPLNAVLNLGNTLIERIFPDPAQANAAKLQLLALQQSGDLQEISNVYSDIANARLLAASDIAKGNAFTGALAAIVRPLWGIGAFCIIAQYAIAHTPIDPGLKEIIELVVEFYFGGRVVEKVTPHVAAGLSKLIGAKNG